MIWNQYYSIDPVTSIASSDMKHYKEELALSEKSFSMKVIRPHFPLWPVASGRAGLERAVQWNIEVNTTSNQTFIHKHTICMQALS